MCRLAAADSDLLMVDPWEALQAEFQRSIKVLKRIERGVNAARPEGMRESCALAPILIACFTLSAAVGYNSYCVGQMHLNKRRVSEVERLADDCGQLVPFVAYIELTSFVSVHSNCYGSSLS